MTLHIPNSNTMKVMFSANYSQRIQSATSNNTVTFTKEIQPDYSTNPFVN